MIKLVLFIVSYLGSTLCYGSLPVGSGLISTKDVLSYKVGYFHASDENSHIQDVLNLGFMDVDPQFSFPVNNPITWYKITLNNPLPESLDLALHSEKAYLSKVVEVYEPISDTEIYNERYSTFDETNSKLTGSSVVFYFTIQAGSYKTIYLRNEAMVNQLIDLKVYTREESIIKLINKNFISNTIIIIIVALALYYLMLFIFIYRSDFIYYSLYLLNAALGLFFLYGSIFHNLHIYGESIYFLNLTAIFVPLFLSLFLKSIFEVKKYGRRINLVFNGIIVASIALSILAVLVDLILAMNLLPILYGLSFISVIYMAVILFENNHPLLKLFILAYLFYILGMALTLFTLNGLIPFNDWYFHASGMGLIVEALLFSYLLNLRIKMLESKVLTLIDTKNSFKSLANIDDLTKCLNRRSFNKQSKLIFTRAKDHQTNYSFLMLDIDYFKNINDSFGHHTGDLCLEEFSNTIKKMIRSEDIFGRLGGEEFAIILPRLNCDQAMIVAEKLRVNIEKLVITNEEHDINIKISIGVSSYTDCDKEHTDIHQRADEALYQAKTKGRNQSVYS